MKDYKKGDRVRLIAKMSGGQAGAVPIGTYGTIKTILEDYVQVNWEDYDIWAAEFAMLEPVSSTDFNINTDPKTWTTKDGLGVTIYTKDGPARSPIHGLIEGATSPIAWTKDGLAVDSTSCAQDGWCDYANLISPRKTVKVDFWVNVYPTGPALCAWPTRKEADEATYSNRIACKHIVMEVEEGEFDKESEG